MKQLLQTKKKIFSVLLLTSCFFILTSLSFATASTSVGTIISGSQYARVCHDINCATYGTINFLPTYKGTTTPLIITDTSITGYVWGDELGWINMAPSGAGVTVDPATGILYGTAFSQTSGWINFRPPNGGVTINEYGEFIGYAWNGGIYGGWIKFDCAATSTCVKTDWIPSPVRTSTVTSGGGGFRNPDGTYSQTIPSESINATGTASTSTSSTNNSVSTSTNTSNNSNSNNSPDSSVSSNSNVVTNVGTGNAGNRNTSNNGNINGNSGTQSGGATVGTDQQQGPSSLPSTTEPRSNNNISNQNTGSVITSTSSPRIIAYPFIPNKVQLLAPLLLKNNTKIDLISVVLTIGLLLIFGRFIKFFI